MSIKNLFLFSILPLSALAVQVQTIEKRACVEVVNQTPNELKDLYVVHKYSDVFHNQRNWSTVAPNSNADGRLMVDYRTGFLTLGVDWWKVFWNSAESDRSFMSGTISDSDLEGKSDSMTTNILKFAAGKAGNRLAGKLHDKVAGQKGSYDVTKKVDKRGRFPRFRFRISSKVGRAGTKLIGEIASDQAVEYFGNKIFNSGVTDGFKIHTLRVEDAQQEGSCTKIFIKEDNKIVFSSPSGESSEEYTSRSIDVQLN